MHGMTLVTSLLKDPLAAGRGHQPTMLYPLGADQFIGKAADLFGLPLENHDFQTVMGIKMNMKGRNDILMMRMLVLGQLVRQIPGVMIKDQRDGPHHLLLAIVGPLVIDQRIADQVPDRLGPVTVTLVTDHFVEAVEQTLIN